MKTILASALFASLVACSHAQPVADAKPAPTPAPAAIATPPPAAPVAAPAAAPVAVDNSIYFDFDSAQLSSASEDKLARLGPMLARQSSLNMKVEGNCDERGTEEYNIALGQHRAEAAVKYLVKMGAHKSQLAAISYGKDRPRATGHDEDAWRQNRRDDFLVVRPDGTMAPVSGESMKRFLLALALVVPLGCASVGRNYDSTQLTWLKNNETTKADVLKSMGQPWRVGMDAGNQTWTYSYYEYRAFSDSNSKDLVLHFTPEGKLKSYTLNTSFPDERSRLDPTVKG